MIAQAQPAAQAAESSIRVLAWAGGVATTVAGSWISSKVHLYYEEKKAHLQEIKTKVLDPLRTGLDEHFRPLVGNIQPNVVVEPGAPTLFDEQAKSTEETNESADLLIGRSPAARVFAGVDDALLEDAKRNHFTEQLSSLDTFLGNWRSYTGDCYAWVGGMAREIRMRSGLPPFAPSRKQEQWVESTYVMQFRTAVFVYKRLFRLHAPALRVNVSTNSDLSRIDGEGTALAFGRTAEIEALIRLIDELGESQRQVAAELQTRLVTLQKEFHEVIRKLNYAAASRRLHNGCDLVTFW